MTQPHGARTRIESAGRATKPFFALLARLIGDDDADAVHDLRVWTRRMQQTLDVFYPDDRPARIRKLRRRLRRVRRRLAAWRDYDVALERVRRRARASRSGKRRTAWTRVAEHLERRREQEIASARRRLLGPGVAGLGGALVRRFQEGPGASSEDAVARGLRRRLREAHDRWLAALAAAAEHPDVERVHALRIATKRLRYRIELARPLAPSALSPALGWAKRLQEGLGEWHDHQVLEALVTQALANPEMLLHATELVRVVLGDLERDRRTNEPVLEELLRSAADEGPRASLVAWLVPRPADGDPTGPGQET